MTGSRFLTWALLGVAAAALVAHSLAFNFVTDDAFISFVYARNLARHGQLVFNLGEPPVEGYTNFLWTVILAALLKVGLGAELMSRVLGTACAVGTMAVTAVLSRFLREASEWSPWDALPALLLCAVPGFACWASGGLETQLFTLLVMLGAAAHLAGRPRRCALAFGVAALTRPEGILFFAVTGLHQMIENLAARRRPLSRAQLAAPVIFLALVVPHFLWRHWYYGWWLPNTFYIKASGGAGTWAQGAYYLGRVVTQFHLWLAPVLLGGGLLLRRERRVLAFAGYAALLVTVFFLYVASVGGDFMGLYRFVMPAIPLCALAAAHGLRLSLAEQRRWAPVVCAGLLAVHGALAWRVSRDSLAFIGADRGIDSPGYLRWYTADRAAIGKWFGRYARDDDYAAVGGAGAQVYYSNIRSLDCFGLSDAHIAHEVPAHSSRPGHQKYAPDDYILSRRPTIITSHNYRIGSGAYVGPDAPFWSSRGYHYVTVDVPGLSSPQYSFLLRNDRSLGPLPALSGQEP